MKKLYDMFRLPSLCLFFLLFAFPLVSGQDHGVLKDLQDPASNLNTTASDSATSFVPGGGMLRLNEIMAANSNIIHDEFGNFEDWIEIYNEGDVPVDLEGWGLSDNYNRPFKWTFPSGVVLKPGEHLLVWASGQDLIGSRASGTVGIVPAGSIWAYHDEGADLGTAWRGATYDDRFWRTGPAPLGYGPLENYETTTVLYGRDSSNKFITTYFRKAFDVADTEKLDNLTLHLWVDDGAVVYLNGEEIARQNMPSGEIDYLTEALVAVGSWPTWTSVEVSKDKLTTGRNLLAAQVHQHRPSSSDLIFDLRLETTTLKPSLHTNFRISESGEEIILTHPDGTRIDELPPTPMEANVSIGRSRDDPEKWVFFANPTPGAENAGLEGHRLLNEVMFSEVSRTFTGSMTFEINGADDGQVIRYTTDGSVPNNNSSLYTGPIEVDHTLMVRARVFDETGASGPIDSRHFLRLAADLVDRRSNLPQVVLDARGQAMDPDGDVRRDGFFHLFDRGEDGTSNLSNIPEIATRQGLRWRGSSSMGAPKKPYAVEFWNEADDDREIEVLGMAAESDWVFYAGWSIDRTFIRNSLIYDISRDMGRWAPESRFVEVFYNADGGDLRESDYVGVYAIIERIKQGPKRLGPENVNRRDTPPPGPIDVEAKGPWTGGYIFKFDRDGDDEYVWTTNGGRTLVLSRPKLARLDGLGTDGDIQSTWDCESQFPAHTSTRAEADEHSRQAEYLRGYVQAFEDALLADHAGGFQTRNYTNYIDFDSWIDHLILIAFSKDADGLRLSSFYHKPEDGKIIAGPAWDFDRSMGSYDSRDDEWDTWYGQIRYFEYRWWGTLCDDPDFIQAFYDRWAELRQNVFSSSAITSRILAMANEIDDSSNSVGSAAARDAARWPTTPPRDGAYANEISDLRAWTVNRADWMDRRQVDGNLMPVSPIIDEQALLNGVIALIGRDQPIYFSKNGEDPRASGGGIAGELYTGAPIMINGPTKIIARTRHHDGRWSTPLVFVAEVQVPNPENRGALLHYWSFNMDSLDPDFTLGGGGLSTTEGPETEFVFAMGGEFEGINAWLGEAPGSHLRVNNPLESSLDFSLPTTGYENVVFRYESRRSGQGAGLQQISYTTDGVEYIDWPGPVTVNNDVPAFYSFDFSGIPAADDNSNFAVRITFQQGEGGTAGNNRFDNISLEGEALPGVNQPPRVVKAPELLEGSVGVPLIVDLTEIFYDPDGDDLTYQVITSRAEVATATLNGDSLELHGVFQGESEVLLSADDGVNPGVSVSFRVLIYPAPFPLIQGPFVFDTWSPAEPTGSYPEHMLFLQSDQTDPDLDALLKFAYAIPLDDASIAVDAEFPYAASNRTRINALGDEGISFINTGRGRDLGAALVALDTRGATGIDVTWTAETLLPNSRIYGIRLQSRVGLHASWNDVLDDEGQPVEYIRGEEGDEKVLGPVRLPEALEGESYVQLRWKYHHISITSGPRAKLRLDNIIVAAEAVEDSYTAWLERTFPDPDDRAREEISGGSADPRGEGLPNLLRYALELETGEPMRSLIPQAQTKNDVLSLLFRRDPRKTDIAYIVEASSNLSDWNKILYDSREHTQANTDGDFMRVEDSKPLSEGTRTRFLRLRIELK